MSRPKIQIRTPGDRHLEEEVEAGRVDGYVVALSANGDTREDDDGGRAETQGRAGSVTADSAGCRSRAGQESAEKISSGS